MKLITEHTNEIEYLTEGKGKEQYIKGIFMQADIKNRMVEFIHMLYCKKK